MRAEQNGAAYVLMILAALGFSAFTKKPKAQAGEVRPGLSVAPIKTQS